MAAELALDEGNWDLARAWLEANDRWLETTGSGAGHGENRQLWAGYFLLNGNVDLAREYAKQAIREATNPRQPLTLIASSRFLGRLESKERNDDIASSNLAEAAELADRCQAPFELALTWVAQAELARSSRDVPRAAELLSRATAVFEELEAAPALERANDLAVDLANLNRDYPDGLTPREVEVLGHVATGSSNRVIADHLYLSVRTVERHLTNIYRKIDAANRSEAREYAQEHNIINCDDIAAG